jgi:NitT/TauT family transport system substrate-binding protein
LDDVTTVVVGDTGPVMAKAFRDGAIDAIAAAINDMTTIESAGYKTRDITPQEVKINPANTFSVWEPRMEELRPDLEKFFRVWTMGTAAGKIDREAVAKMSAKSVPEEWATEELGQSLLSGAFVTNFPVTEKYGDVQLDVWAKVQGPYVKFEQIEGEVDPATFLDGSFIDAANDFDEEALRTALAEWKAANP